MNDVRDAEFPSLPDAPAGLPTPWSWKTWARWFSISLFVSALLVWQIGRAFQIPVLSEFVGACASVGGVFLVLGLILINRFSTRGFYRNYAAKANKSLNRAMRRYRKKKPPDSLFSLFPEYLVDGDSYYLVWYVPWGGSMLVTKLSSGAEPLIFDREGQWVDDEELLHKLLLMWSVGIDLSPRTIPLSNPLTKDYRELSRLLSRHLVDLPELLELNRAILMQKELGDELHILEAGHSSKIAYYRNTIDILVNKIEWAEAHGWDSLVQLRYDDVARWYEAYAALVRSRIAFAKEMDLEGFEAAAVRVLKVVSASGQLLGAWERRTQLVRSLRAAGSPIATGEIDFEKVNGLWRAPSIMVDAYRSRVAYAREIDGKRGAAEPMKDHA